MPVACRLSLSSQSQPSRRSWKCTTPPERRSVIKLLAGCIMDLWQSTSGWRESQPWTFWTMLLCELTCLLTKGWKTWHWRKSKKQNADSLFLWFICWFLPRCEYDSMFVQDDVILNVDFFFQEVAFIADCSMHYYYYSPLQATVSGCRPCRLFEQTASEETKVNKEMMFWPSGVNGVLKTRQIFLENEFLEQLPWKFKCFFNVTYLIWNCFIWISMEI